MSYSRDLTLANYESVMALMFGINMKTEALQPDLLEAMRPGWTKALLHHSCKVEKQSIKSTVLLSAVRWTAFREVHIINVKMSKT